MALTMVNNFLMTPTMAIFLREGMPRAMLTPHPYEFIDAGDTIIVRGHEFNIERTIHMTRLADPADEPPSPLGYSVGRWEGDTLVVETTNFRPDLAFRGASEKMKLVERFTRTSPDTMMYEFTVTDPAGAASEKVTFAKVYQESLVMAEADDANTISFAGRDFEVGGAEHRTSFHVTKIENADGRSVLTLRKGIEVMQSHVTASDPASGRVTTGIAMLRFRGREIGRAHV